MFKSVIKITFISILFIYPIHAETPRKDKGKFVENRNAFLEKIKSDNAQYAQERRETFVLDFEGMDLPTNKEEYTTYWHNDPISQGNSGMCWCFCTTSFYESEIYRTTGRKIKLSELHTVYWEYVEKARRFVQKRGKSLFAQGSMGNHIPIIWEKYGVVPAETYTGKEEDAPFHDHPGMFEEMESYLKHVQDNYLWDEETVLSNIKVILNNHLGEPPAEITVNGKTMTPVQYFKEVINIDFDNYVDVLSLLEKSYGEYVVYPVPDNWWKGDQYFNVSLDQFMAILKNAVRNDLTVSIGGDVSEAGLYSYADVAMVPTFDIPSDYIDDNARQFRFSNKSTTDDHGVHIVGYLKKDGKDWFLIKDSGSGARNGENKGYYFYHEDYIKLKMMDFLVHKDALKGIVALP